MNLGSVAGRRASWRPETGLFGPVAVSPVIRYRATSSQVVPVAALVARPLPVAGRSLPPTVVI